MGVDMSHTSRQELFDSRRLPMPEGKGRANGDPSLKDEMAKSTRDFSKTT
jgi:hypothetical protein